MGNLKPRDFYPDFHVNIRKDGRVNGIKPVTLKDMGLPYDLDYPEQKVGDLSKEQLENLVEEFIFLIDELLPRDIQDLFYKATLDPRCYSSHYPSHISEKFCKLKEGTVYSNLSDVASDCFILYLLLS